MIDIYKEWCKIIVFSATIQQTWVKEFINTWMSVFKPNTRHRESYPYRTPDRAPWSRRGDRGIARPAASRHLFCRPPAGWRRRCGPRPSRRAAAP